MDAAHLHDVQIITSHNDLHEHYGHTPFLFTSPLQLPLFVVDINDT